MVVGGVWGGGAVDGPPIGCLLSPLLPGSAVRLLAVYCLHSPGVRGPPALRAGCLLSLPFPPPSWVHGPPLLSVVPPVPFLLGSPSAFLAVGCLSPFRPPPWARGPPRLSAVSDFRLYLFWL